MLLKMMLLTQKRNHLLNQPNNPISPEQVLPELPSPDQKTPERKCPERKCIVTGERLSVKGAAIRFVLTPDGVIVPDVGGKLPGRGAWVLAKRDVVAQAAGKLRKSFGGKETLDDLPVLVEDLLLKRCQALLSLGRKSGSVLGGGGKIRARGAVLGLLLSHDASPRESRALRGDVDHDWVIDSMSGDELGSPFGLPSIAFVAVLGGSKTLVDDLFRLHQYRL